MGTVTAQTETQTVFTATELKRAGFSECVLCVIVGTMTVLLHLCLSRRSMVMGKVLLALDYDEASGELKRIPRIQERPHWFDTKHQDWWTDEATRGPVQRRGEGGWVRPSEVGGEEERGAELQNAIQSTQRINARVHRFSKSLLHFFFLFSLTTLSWVTSSHVCTTVTHLTHTGSHTGYFS